MAVLGISWWQIMMHEPLMQNKDEAALEQLFNAYDTDFDGIISKKVTCVLDMGMGMGTGREARE